MGKDRKNILLFCTCIVFTIFFCYTIYSSGAFGTMISFFSRLSATASDSNVKENSKPVIYFVINSSGEEIVNTDVVITLKASSSYDINKVEYSFNGKKWHSKGVSFKKGKDIVGRIVFKKNMDETVYIKVTNSIGSSSYFYKTNVIIDKEKPIIKRNNTVFEISDNYMIEKLQCSIDGYNYDDMDTEKSKKLFYSDKKSCNYIRAVDTAGNISNVMKIK